MRLSVVSIIGINILARISNNLVRTVNRKNDEFLAQTSVVFVLKCKEVLEITMF